MRYQHGAPCQTLSVRSINTVGQVPVLIAAVTNQFLYWRHAHPVIDQLMSETFMRKSATSWWVECRGSESEEILDVTLSTTYQPWSIQTTRKVKKQKLR